MRAVRFVAAVFALALALPAAAQTATIGLLHFGERKPYEPYLEAFREGLRENGFAEGRNLRIEYRFADNDHAKLGRLAAELVRLKVSAVYAPAPPAVHALKSETKTVPVVFSVVSDPVALKFVASLARPGGNITGISVASSDLPGKRLEMLRDSFPKARRVAIVYDEYQAKACQVELTQLKGAADQLGLSVEALPYRSRQDLDSVFSRVRASRSDAILSPVSLTDIDYGPEISERVAASRLPAMHSNAQQVLKGSGLVSYGPDSFWVHRRAGYYVARILKGTAPADLPVEQPSRYELVVNLKAARAQGVAIPETVLVRATKVIE